MNEGDESRVTIKAGATEVSASAPIAKNILRQIARRSRQIQGRPWRLKDVINKLIEEGFFDTPDGRTLSGIREGLLLHGMDMETTSISPILYRDFVSKGIIQRAGRRRSYKYFVRTDD